MKKIENRAIFKLLLILTLTTFILSGKDFYKVLGVSRRSNTKQIKRAFRKLSKKYHPDRNSNRPKWAKKKFLEITEAYEVLKDEKLRRIYDQGGEEAVKDHQQGGGGGGGHGHHGGNFNFEDMFGSFFGGGGFGGGGRQRKRGGERRQQHHHQDYGDDGFGGFGGYPSEVSWKDSEVIVIDDNDKIQDFENRRVLYSILFYSSSTFENEKAEIWKEVAKKVNGMAQIAAVDCDERRKFCRKYGGRQDPIIKAFPSDKQKRSVNLGGSIENANWLVKKILGHLENYVKKINNGNWSNIKSSAIKDKKHIFLLFSSRNNISALLKSVSGTFKDKIILGQVHQNDQIARKMGIRKFPSLVWVKDVEKLEYNTYDGNNDKFSMMLWIQSQAQKRFKSPDKKVIEVTKAIVQEHCGPKEKNYCLIGFYSNHSEKREIEENLKSVLAKYQQDKLLIFIANASKLRRSCLFGRDSSDQYYFMRTKRRKYSNFGSGLKKEELASKIDNKLSGSMIKSKMSKFPISCFY